MVSEQTENGVSYDARLYEKNVKYKMIIEQLDAMKPAWLDVASGKQVKSYRIGTQQMDYNVMSPGDIMKRYEELMTQKTAIENGTSSRRAFYVVPR